MSDQEQWAKNNEAYLSAALEWIRLRLIHLAPEARPAEATPAGSLARLFGGKPARPEVAGCGAAAAPSEKDIAAARQALDKCAQADPLPAAQILQKHFDLSEFELQILLLCASVELDSRIAGLCARAHHDANKAFPTFALALALFPSRSWDALSPERPLRFWRLIEMAQTPAAPLTLTPLRADERILNYLKGLNHLDERLTTLLTLLSAPGQKRTIPLAPSHAAISDQLVRGLISRTTSALVHLLGADSASKQQIASAVADQLSTGLYLLPASVLPASPTEIESLARAWRRETLLLPVSLYLDAKEAERDAPSVTRFLSRSDGLVFLDTRDNWRNLQREGLVVEVEKPARTEQQASWNRLLNQPSVAAALASQFSLSQREIYRAAARCEAGPGVEDRLWEECRMVSRPKLDLLAQRLDAKATWDDFVLPASETNALREICIHARQRVQVYDVWGFSARMNRGMGSSALFAGESGTGKTMAAEVIANELKLNLYRIDLSAVVSKYIGETEKNLRQVFDAAEDGASILFFDEADALFGKRSEVKDSHDRYANIEINYLLQRMEAYSGLAILATNLKTSLDTAFLRRLRFIVQFPFPNVAERKRIWERAFPAGMPNSPLDLDFLSRLNVAGGTIHNIALKAAFLAAGRGQSVSMDLVLEAARSEFRKLERPVNESDFRWHTKPVAQVERATA
jgi:ATPase family associated with various cellular activities (AAA)